MDKVILITVCFLFTVCTSFVPFHFFCSNVGQYHVTQLHIVGYLSIVTCPTYTVYQYEYNIVFQPLH